MIKIKFKEMKILENKRTTTIIGEYKKREMKIELSILQLAKAFQCDKEVLKELENEGFGSEELEDKCKEIIEIIKKFPDVKIGKNLINCGYISAREEGKIAKIFGEDLCGWNNEGIMVIFPTEVYNKELKGKKFEMILKQDSVELNKK